MYYEVSQSYDFYKPLATIFGNAPTEGESAEDTMGATLELASKKFWQTAGNVELAVYTGVFTRDESAGVDLVLVGDLNKAQVQNLVSELEVREGKELRYTVMDTAQADYRSQINDRFWQTLVRAKKQVIVDKKSYFTIVKDTKADKVEE